MGMLVEGEWVDKGYDTAKSGGRFERSAAAFRNWVTPDGAPGPSGEGGFAGEAGRYHLIVSLACPWAHRALIVRKLKGLEDIIPFTSVHWEMLEKGWRFPTSADTDLPGENATPDPVKGHENFTHLRDIYFSVEPNYTGRFTVPTLYDKVQHKIVSNESSEIIRMFYTEFDDLVGEEYRKVDLLPKDLVGRIEEVNDWTYNDINNGKYALRVVLVDGTVLIRCSVGVYKSGFAT